MNESCGTMTLPPTSGTLSCGTTTLQSHSQHPGQFDPTELANSATNYLFDAPPVVSQYVEKYFRNTLSDSSRKVMTEAHPRPRTDALLPQKVDDTIVTWLGNQYSNVKGVDGSLSALQLGLQQAMGPMSCLWTQFETDARLKPDTDTDEPVQLCDLVAETRDVIQRTIVMVGHVNASLCKLRRQLLLEVKDKELARYQKESDLPTSGQQLFGTSFNTSLLDKVKAGKALSDASRLVSQAKRDSTATGRRSSFSSRPPFRKQGSMSFSTRRGAPTTRSFIAQGSLRTDSTSPDSVAAVSNWQINHQALAHSQAAERSKRSVPAACGVPISINGRAAAEVATGSDISPTTCRTTLSCHSELATADHRPMGPRHSPVWLSTMTLSHSLPHLLMQLKFHVRP